ncbi:MAG: Fic family protein [Nanobdellota archaeon]
MEKMYDVLKLSEDENLEFKEAKSQFNFDNGRKSLCGYLIALANEGGGKLILGVKNNKKIVGTNSFLDINDLKSKVFQKIQRRIEVYEYQVDKKRVLVISIDSRPVGEALAYDGAYLMRVGEELVPMSSEQLKKIYSEHIDDFSAQTLHGVGFSDVDSKAVKKLRSLLKKSRRIKFSIDSLSDEQLLKNLKLLKGNSLTRAGLVLLGKSDSIQEHLPFSEIRFGYKTSISQETNQEKVIYNKAYLLYFDDLWKKINLRNHFIQIPKGLQVQEEYAFSETAIREAINNAIIHRDYSETGSIIIQQTEDFIEIKNPGGFPKGITAENIFDETNPRNKLIADTLFLCDFIEAFGEGANKIYVNQVMFGRKSPDYSLTNPYHVVLRLYVNIFSLKLAKVVNELTTFGLKLGFIELRYLYEKIVNSQIQDEFGNLPIGKDGFFEGKLHNLNYLLDADSTPQATPQVTPQVSDQVSDQASDQVKILRFCKTEKSILEIMKLIGLKHRTYFRKNMLKPLLNKKLLELTIPDKPNSPNQKYVITRKGLEILK